MQGIKHADDVIGSAFCGRLTATGTAVLLTAPASAIGAGVGVATNTDPGEVARQTTPDATTVGIVSGIVLAVNLLIAADRRAGRRSRLPRNAWSAGEACG